MSKTWQVILFFTVILLMGLSLSKSMNYDFDLNAILKSIPLPSGIRSAVNNSVRVIK